LNLRDCYCLASWSLLMFPFEISEESGFYERTYLLTMTLDGLVEVS
jgi:hypothetical protein